MFDEGAAHLVLDLFGREESHGTVAIGSFASQEAVRTTRKVRGSPWPERDPELRALWDEGLSGSEIGRRMGFTKNQILGRVHRIPLSPRPSPLRPPSAKPAPRPRAALKGSTLPPLSIQRAPPKKPVFVASPPAPAPVKITRVRTCLWPSGHTRRNGGTGITFDCTDPAMPERPYCLEHCAVAYRLTSETAV